MTLYVSFWDVCLENFSEGTMVHRQVTIEAARRYVAEARQHGRLACVSGDDLMAPYKTHALDRQKALCATLTLLDVPITFEDFAIKDETVHPPLYCIAPLQLARVRADARLLVVTCNFTMGPWKADHAEPLFGIAPGSVRFHLFEQEA